MSLKNLVRKEVTCAFDYPNIEGFKVTLRYMGKDEMQKVYDRCTVKRFDTRTHQAVKDFQPEKFKEYVCKEIIVSWEGLTYDKIKKLIPLNIAELTKLGLTLNDNIESTFENKLDLLNESTEFDSRKF
jgi:hypothetical protein